MTALALASLVVLGGWSAAAVAPPAEPETHAYAVIVANNVPADGSLAKLRYADDDGARWMELLGLVSKRTELLSVLDADTQRLHPEAARRARVPTRKELLATLDSVYADIAKDEQAGVRTVLYFVFVGHGSVGPDGEGTVHLLDGRFTRSDLYQRVIDPSPARVNHVIIDACNAYLMVARRGAGGKERAIDDAVEGFVGREGLERHPNTGVLVSTSKAAEVHEWSRFEAGIFSHEARSALAGAADVDGDGAVSYDEARAFIAAANAKVTDPKAKLFAYAAPPAIHRAEPLFERRAAKAAPVLRVPASLTGRRWLEDARGVRYADFNVAPDGPLTLVLVPSSSYFLRSDTEEQKIPLAVAREIDAGTLAREPVQLASRGAEALAFQRDLFQVGFGRAYFEGYRASAPSTEARAYVPPAEDEGLPTRKLVAGGLAVGSAVALVVGGLYGSQASERAETYRSAIGTSAGLEALRADADAAATTANLLYLAAGGLLTTAAVLWLWPGE